MLFTNSGLWTPTQLTSELWYDASDAATITLNGSNVSQWNDKSGNNRNATQGTASLQPLFVSNASNGLPALQTDGGDILVVGNKVNLFRNIGDATIAIMVKYTAGSYTANAISAFVSTGTSGTTTRFGLTGSPGGFINNLGFLGRRNDTDNPAATLASSTLRTASVSIQIGNAIYSSALANHFTNGNQDLTNATFLTAGLTSNTDPLSASVFGINFLTSGNPPLNPLPSGCQLFEVLMFNSTLSTTDRQKLEGYLAWKWGTVASLPAGHPYKNSPPYLP
jgi:hypothetical protein